MAFINVTNDFQNVTTFKQILSVANYHTSGYAYLGILVMLFAIFLINLLPFGIEIALLSSSFVTFVIGIFLVYLDLLAVQWLYYFIGLMLAVMIYIVWTTRSSEE